MNPQQYNTHSNQNYQQPNPPPGFGNDQKFSNLEKTFNSFMQNTTQMLNSHQQMSQKNE